MHRLLVLLSVALVGCSSAQGTHSPVGSTQRSTDLATDGSRHLLEVRAPGAAMVPIAASPDRVWEALPVVYTELGLTGQVLDAQRRIFGQPETTMRRRLQSEPLSRFLDCGMRSGIANANSYNVRVSVRTQVLADGADASQLLTQVEASAYSSGGTDPWVRCGSTNALEQRIVERLRQQLARGPAA
jgi:hypothetical protein